MKTNERIEETLEKLWEQLEENTGGKMLPEILDPEQNVSGYSGGKRAC